MLYVNTVSKFAGIAQCWYIDTSSRAQNHGRFNSTQHYQTYKSHTARHVRIGISPQLGWEYLHAGRALRSLPTTTALFRAGKLTWSKIRAISRVADKDNEKLLCHAALDASATEVARLCSGSTGVGCAELAVSYQH